MCIRVLFIQIHPKVLCKPPMFSKHPRSPKRKRSRAEMCPAVPRSLRGAGSDAWQMSLEGISVPEQSRPLWSVGLPFQSHRLRRLPASVAGFENVGLSLDCVLLGGAPSPCFLMHYYEYNNIYITALCIQGVDALIKLFSSIVVQSR